MKGEDYNAFYYAVFLQPSVTVSQAPFLVVLYVICKQM
jgi:hypothetical protein